MEAEYLKPDWVKADCCSSLSDSEQNVEAKEKNKRAKENLNNSKGERERIN